MIEKQILVIIKNPGEEPSVEPLFENTPQAFSDAVGGEPEALSVCTDLKILYCRDGEKVGEPFNFTAFGVKFYGPVIAVGTKGNEVVSLKATNVPLLLRELQERKNIE